MLINIKQIAVIIMVFITSFSCSMDKPGDDILKTINEQLGKGKVINSSTINNDHIKNNHFIGVFEDKSSFVSKQFEIIRRIVTASTVTFETDKEVLQFIENIGLGGASYLHKKRHEIFSDVHGIFVHLFRDVMKSTITATTTPNQIQQFLLAFLQNSSNSSHQSFWLALRMFSYASSVKTLFKLVEVKAQTKNNIFQLDDSGKYYGVREIEGDGIVLQVVQQTTVCENPKKYSFLEIAGNEEATEGKASSKFWLLDLSPKGNLSNFLRRFVANYGLFRTMAVYDNRGSIMIEFMMSDPIPVVHHCYILGKGWQSYRELNIDYFPQSRFCALAVSGKPKKIASVYMISPYIFLNKRNPFEGLQGCFQGGTEIKSVPQVFSKVYSGTKRELLPSSFDTMEQQGIHVFDDYLESAANRDASFTQIEEVFHPEAVTRNDFRALLGDEHNQTLTKAVNQLFDYIDNSTTIQLFFGSIGRGYTAENMQTHLRRIINLLPAIMGADDTVRQNVITSLIENIQLNGGCAQGYRNRLYAIIAASL